MVNSLGFARRAVAGVATAAILATQLVTAPFAAAQSAQFSDVASDNFAYDYIYQLVDMGVVNGYPDGTFRPNAYLNRAEMAKIATKLASISGVIMDASDISNAPSFSDVSSDAWFYGYVAAAAKNGIFEGYRDASGNLTGMFGPADTVLRAQAAKILMIAAGVPNMMTPAAPFVDVNPSDWFYGYVTSAYNWSILDGYKDASGNLTGYFGPADPVTRGQIAKIGINAQNPVNRYDGTTPVVNDNTNMTNMNTNTGSGTNMNSNVPMSNASFEAALSSSTPASMTLATGTAFNVVAKLDLTAGNEEDVKVTGLTVMHRGISPDSIVNGVLIVDKDGKRHGNIVSFSDSKAMIDFSTNPIVVAKGTTHTMSIQTNFNTQAGFSGTYKVEVPANGIMAWGASTGGKVNVMGTFPISAPEFPLVSGTNIGNVSIENRPISAAQQTVDLGTKNRELSKFKITQANSQEELALSELTFFNNGNASDTDVNNLKLIAQDGTVLATVANSTNRYVTFDLSAKPYTIPKGTSRDVSIFVDVVGGSARTVQFVISNDYDVKIKGKTSQAFLLPTVGTGDMTDTSFPIGDNAGNNTIFINEGSLTVSKSTTSPSGEVARGGTDVTIAEFKVEAAGEDIEIQGATLTVATVQTGVPTCAVAGSCSLKGTFKVVNGSGSTLHSINTVDAANPTLYTTGVSVPRFNNFYTVKAGTSGIIKFVVDVNDNANAGQTITGGVSNLIIKKLSSNRVQSNVAPLGVTASPISITTAILSVSKFSGEPDKFIVKGTSNQKIGTVTLGANNADGVNVSSIVVNFSGSVGAPLDATNFATAGITNLKLMKSGVQLGQTIQNPGFSSNSFSVTGNLSIAKSQNATVDVYADVATSSALVNINAVIPMNGVSGTSIASSNSVNAPSVAATLQTNTITTSGNATVSTVGSQSSAVLASGESNVPLFKFGIKASNNEALRVERFKIAVAGGIDAISTVQLFDSTTGANLGDLNLTNGIATFSGLSTEIPKNTTREFNVTARVHATGALDSDSQIVGGLYEYRIVGVSSGISVEKLAGTEKVTTGTPNGEAETYNAGDVLVSNLGLVPSLARNTVAGTAVAAGFADTAQVSVLPSKSASTGSYNIGEIAVAAGTTTLGIATSTTQIDGLAAATASILPTKSIEIIGTTQAQYDYSVGEAVVVRDGAVTKLAVVATAGTSATVTFSPAIVLNAADIVSVLPMLSTEATAVAANYIRGDVVFLNTGGVTTLGVVTSATNAATLQINGANYVAGTVTKLMAARGAGNTMIVEDVYPVIALSAPTTSTITGKPSDVIGNMTITARGQQQLNIKTLVFTTSGNYTANTGTVTEWQLWNGNKIAEVAGNVASGGTVTFNLSGSDGQINAGQTANFVVKANTSNVRGTLASGPISLGIQLKGTAGLRGAANSVLYAYTNGKTTLMNILTNVTNFNDVTSSLQY